MLNQRKSIGEFHVVLIHLLIITLLVISTPLFGVKAEGKPEGKSDDKASFELTVEEDPTLSPLK